MITLTSHGKTVQVSPDKICIFRNPARKWGPYLFEEFLVGYWKPIEDGKEGWYSISETKEQIEELLQHAQIMTSNPNISLYSRVIKDGGDYTFEGEVRCIFTKRSGAIRYVVENDAGIVHIFSAKNIRLAESSV